MDFEPSCPQCEPEKQRKREEADLICFHCQNEMEVCSRCNTTQSENSSSEDNPSVQTQPTSAQDSAGPQPTNERLATIIEARGDTGSCSDTPDSDPPRKLNGSTKSTILNYIILLTLWILFHRRLFLSRFQKRSYFIFYFLSISKFVCLDLDFWY